MCHKKANVVSSRSYRSRTGPARYDYPGLDDGTRCKSKGGVKASKPRSAKQRANDARLRGMSRAAIFKKQRGGFEEPTEEFMMGGYYESSDDEMQDGGYEEDEMQDGGYEEDEMQDGGADGCGFKADTMRCAKGVKSNEQWCQMGKKGRCVKSAAGKRSAPKRAASAKQLAGLA